MRRLGTVRLWTVWWAEKYTSAEIKGTYIDWLSNGTPKFLVRTCPPPRLCPVKTQFSSSQFRFMNWWATLLFINLHGMLTWDKYLKGSTTKIVTLCHQEQRNGACLLILPAGPGCPYWLECKTVDLVVILMLNSNPIILLLRLLESLRHLYFGIWYVSLSCNLFALPSRSELVLQLTSVCCKSTLSVSMVSRVNI